MKRKHYVYYAIEETKRIRRNKKWLNIFQDTLALLIMFGVIYIIASVIIAVDAFAY